jgi:hypothetical protein
MPGMTVHTTKQPGMQSADAQVQDHHLLNATDCAATGEDHSLPCSSYSCIHNMQPRVSTTAAGAYQGPCQQWYGGVINDHQPAVTPINLEAGF